MSQSNVTPLIRLDSLMMQFNDGSDLFIQPGDSFIENETGITFKVDGWSREIILLKNDTSGRSCFIVDFDSLFTKVENGR